MFLHSDVKINVVAKILKLLCFWMFLSSHQRTLCFFPEYFRSPYKTNKVPLLPDWFLLKKRNKKIHINIDRYELLILMSSKTNNEASSPTTTHFPLKIKQSISSLNDDDNAVAKINKPFHNIVIDTWYNDYYELMSHIMNQDDSMKPVRKKGKNRINRDELTAVQEYLLKVPVVLDYKRHSFNESDFINHIFNDCIQRDSLSSTAGSCHSIREKALKNRHAFWYHAESDNNDNPIIGHTEDPVSKRVTTSQQKSETQKVIFTKPDIQSDYAFCCLSYITDVCAREEVHGPCLVAWFKMMECGMIPHENCVSAVLYVLSSFLASPRLSKSRSEIIQMNGMSTTNSSNSSKFHDAGVTKSYDDVCRQVVEEKFVAKACLDVATFHDMLYEPNEKTITLRIKRLLSEGNVVAAEQILSSLPDKRTDPTNGKRSKATSPTLSNEKSSKWKRLRTYLPILTYYCTDETDESKKASSTTMSISDKTKSALRLFREMRVSNGVNLDSETYALLISALAKRGSFFLKVSRPIEEEISQHHDNDNSTISPKKIVSDGPALFDYLATEMANDILELDEVSARMIYDSFVDGYETHYQNITSTVAKYLTKESDCVAVELQTKQSRPNAPGCRLIIGRVSVDIETSLCRKTGAKLRLFTLNESQRLSMHDTLLMMAAQQHEEYGEKLQNRRMSGTRQKKMENSTNVEMISIDYRPFDNRDHPTSASKESIDSIHTTFNGHMERDGRYAYKQLYAFSEWFRNQSDIAGSDGLSAPRYTAIVDGPNVAYFGHGDIHYSQVQKVVDALEQLGESPLVIMPQKYANDKFWLATGRIQELSEQDKNVRESLLAKEQMYVVPTSCFDDYYWMLASVAYSERLHQQTVLARWSNDSGRFPGLRPLLITNDQMRDHKLALFLDARSFRRWTSCHIVKYAIEPYEDNEWQERKVKFIPAESFSREIQGNQIAKMEFMTDNSRFDQHGAGTVWHMPVTGWNDPERLCIAIVHTT